MTRSKVLSLSGAVAVLAVLWPTVALAQHRPVNRRPPRIIVTGGHYYGAPWFYDPFLWGSPYGWWYPAYPPAVAYGQTSSIRLEVEPKQAEVFVDGYFAGTVDDFDGFFQRLRIVPGEHEIQLYLAGYRTVSQRVYLQPDATFRIRQTMQRLGSNETQEPRPAPLEPVPPQLSGRETGVAPAQRGSPRPDGEEIPQGVFGSLVVRVQPTGTRVVIDDQPWQGPASGEPLSIELPEGEHSVEVTRQGYSVFMSVVHIRRGEATQLNVSLIRE